ncbi:MAG: 50S ribosomal protein L6 [Thermoguttaceae bacterium]|jgi:large subunit ribosomal protein L6|nr:50S ribosomal protein L6 [Thermoguttaceae bacterium]
MSRIGKKPVPVPPGVNVRVDGLSVVVEGPKGQLAWNHRPEVSVAFDEGARQIVVTRKDDQRQTRALHGLTRALVQNMVVGVTDGFERRLEIHGVGYLASLQGQVLQLRVGLANELQVPIPEGVEVTVPDQQHIVLRGIDKQKVSQFAAEIRAKRKPEPYKGKGIRYMGEQIRRKQGKAMAK